MQHEIPKEVMAIAKALNDAGFRAYLVGGCVRDMLLERTPKDWDIATDATPEKIQKLFPESVYENTFGTVGIKIPTPERVGTPTGTPTVPSEQGVGADSVDPTLKIVEVTTFRRDGGYADKRHPDSVTFAKTIEEDLARRDFTVNALAWDMGGSSVIRHPTI